MIYPHHTIAPVIYTDFIEGYKFEICEFIKEVRNEFGVSDKCRFFLVVEDQILGVHFVEKYANASGMNDWSFICADKSFLIDKINSFAKSYAIFQKYQQKVDNGANFVHRLNEIKSNIFEKYGIKV